MSKVFEFNPTYWMVDKVNNSVITNSNCVFSRTNKWLAIQTPFSTDPLVTLSNTVTLWTVFSFIAYIKIYKISTYSFLTWWTSTWSYALWFSSTRIYTNDWANFASIPYSLKIWKWQFIAVRRNWQSCDFFVDWVLIWTWNIPTTNNPIDINKLFKRSNFNYPFYWYCASIVAHDNIISNSSISNEYKRFLQLQPLLEKKTNIFYPKPTTLTEPWLVWAWNMKPNGSTLVDISGNSKNMTKSSWVVSPTIEGVNFKDWANVFYSVAPWTGINDMFQSWWTIQAEFTPVWLWGASAWCVVAKKTTTVSWWFFWMEAGNSLKFIIYRGNPNYSQWETPINSITLWKKVYVQLTYNSSSSWNVPIIKINWVTQTLTSTIVWAWSFVTDSDWSLYIWNRADLAIDFDWNIQSVKLYNQILADSKLNSDYNKWARQIVFKETFAYDKADWNTVVPTGWIAWTWSYKLVTETAWNSIIKKWQKYLQNTVVWTISYQSKQAYWTWEFALHASNNSECGIYFMNDRTILSSNNWYGLYHGTLWLWLYKIVSWVQTQLFLIPLANTNYYDIKITRTNQWLFSVYVKWWIYTNYTSVWTYTDNTITTSSFFIVNNSTFPGLKIADIVIKQWVEV